MKPSNMKSNYIVGLLVLTITLFSCGNSNKDKKDHSIDRIDKDAILNSKSKSSNEKGENTCLLDYREKYDALLSEEDVVSATGFDKEKMTIKYRKTLSDPKYHEYVLSFKNGRKGKIFGSDRVFELPDYITVKLIEEMTVTDFANHFRVVTDEEFQTAQQVLKDVADGKVENMGAQEVLKEAEEKHIDKETIKKSGSTLTNAFSEISKAYININDLGDAAVWNTKTSELNVLQKGVKFTLIAEISNDNVVNKDVAISLAKVILNKCN